MKICTILLKYNYGNKDRGESIESRAFFPSIVHNFDNVSSFWLEDNGFPNDNNNLQRNLLDFVKKEKPNFVFFCLMSYEISIETLKKVKLLSKTINFFCDDQWRFNSYSKFISPYFDIAITTDKYSINEYKKIGVNAFLTPWGTFDYQSSIDFSNKSNFKYDVSFIGSRDITRDYVINCLRENGIHVQCFGEKWPNGRISYEKMKIIIGESKINLNLSNSIFNELDFLRFYKKNKIKVLFKNIFSFSFLHPIRYLKNVYSSLKTVVFFDLHLKSIKNSEQIKARNFEIPGYGGFQISKYALGIEDYYQIGQEICVFNTTSELINQIKYYLANDVERINIQKAAHQKTSLYTYHQIFKKIKNFIINV